MYNFAIRNGLKVTMKMTKQQIHELVLNENKKINSQKGREGKNMIPQLQMVLVLCKVFLKNDI